MRKTDILIYTKFNILNTVPRESTLLIFGEKLFVGSAPLIVNEKSITFGIASSIIGYFKHSLALFDVLGETLGP